MLTESHARQFSNADLYRRIAHLEKRIRETREKTARAFTYRNLRDLERELRTMTDELDRREGVASY